MGRFGKLSRMFIDVAVRAKLKPDLVDREASRRNVTLRARHRCMFALEWIAGHRMLFQSELGRFEPLHGMACRAFGSAGSIDELASVGIWPMTVGAFLECHPFCKVSSSVTPHTADLSMLAKQSKVSFGMVKCAIQSGRQNLVPSRCGVAGLARLRKFAAVGISMAITTAAKCDSSEARLFVMPGRVALLAGNLGMQTSEGVACHRMIESSDVD